MKFLILVKFINIGNEKQNDTYLAARIFSRGVCDWDPEYFWALGVFEDFPEVGD
jgi:hypothetical protein